MIILYSDQYADICVIKCGEGFLKCRAAKGKVAVDSVLVKISIDKDACSWVEGLFEGGSFCSIQPYVWRSSLEEAKEADYEQDVWVHLAQAGITSGYSPDVLLSALEAARKMQAALAEYKETLIALGATQEEEGSYEDYQQWLEIPGCPMVRF